jgi:hypothetical protein
MLWREVQTCNILHGVISRKMIPPAYFCWTYFFHPENGGNMFLRNFVETHGLHGVIFQKMILLAGFGWTYFFHPEDGGNMFLRNVGWNSTENMCIGYLRRLLLPSYFPGSHYISYMSSFEPITEPLTKQFDFIFRYYKDNLTKYSRNLLKI